MNLSEVSSQYLPSFRDYCVRKTSDPMNLSEVSHDGERRAISLGL